MRLITIILALTAFWIFWKGVGYFENISEHHVVLGSFRGWDKSKVAVLSDIKINELRVRHVRVQRLECKSGYKDHLELSGPIGPDSTEVVARVLKKIEYCETTDKKKYAATVYLNSTGGLLADGYKLGLVFRQYQAQAVIVDGQQCASACAIAFLGAPYRALKGNGRLMFHAPYRAGENGDIICIKREQASALKRYMVSFLGAKDGAFLFERAISYCGQRESWEINADAAKLLGIANID